MMTWSKTLAVASCLIGLVLGSQGLSFGAEVNGIYTDPATKDVGKVTHLKIFEGLKARGWISTYYQYNFNDPPNGLVEGGGGPGSARAFDFRHNSLGPVELAEIEFEKVPGVGEVGFKLDLAFGDTQQTISTTANEAVTPLPTGPLAGDNDPTKFVQHASVSYVAPIGRGLRMDFGKFVTHIGGETIAGIKNNYTFSHSFLYTYAIPFQDYGFRFNYPLTDQVYLEYYLLNGWNVASDNNKDKTHGFTVGFTPNPKFALYANYLGGPEDPGNNHDRRDLFDAQVYLNPFGPINIWLFGSYGNEQGAINEPNCVILGIPGSPCPTTGGEWMALDGVIWVNLTDRLIPAFRVEWMKDSYGTMTGTTALGGQELTGLTFTLNYKIPMAGDTHILVRPEYRYDRSNQDVFSKDTPGNRSFQNTLGINAVYYF